MKKAMSVFLAVLYLLLLICPGAMASSVFKVYIDIDFVPNLIFSKYDVDMYLNDLELERLPHGKDYSGSFYAEDGPNTIYFYERGSKSVNGSIKLEIKGNTTISCRISCYNNKIDIDKVSIITEKTESKDTETTEIISREIPIQEAQVPEAINKVIDEPIITETPKEAPEITAVPEPKETLEPTSTPEPTPIPEPTVNPEVKTVTFSDIDLTLMSNEELERAAAAIKSEQRARIKTKIILDNTSISLVVGKTQKIDAHIEDLPPEEYKVPILEWASSDSKIATCKNGIIKAVSGGKVIITCSATLSDGTYISQDCEVEARVLATSVAADKKTIQLKVNEKYTPHYVIKPDTASSKALIYTSSDEDVVTVDKNGTITAEWIGKAKVTATTTDGSNKTSVIDIKVTYDAFLKESNGKQIFNAVCSHSNSVTNRMEGGDDEWFNRFADVDGLSLEVNSEGEYGRALVICVMDILKTNRKEVYYRVLDNVFIGEDLTAATNWVKKNLGKETMKKFGDTYIVLRLTVMKYPIMYLVDEEHLDWI